MDDLTRIQTINRTSLALRSDKTGELHLLSGEMLVGREVECDIQLAYQQISRYHAKIYVSANGVFVEDLKSSNGTYINGRKIRSRTAVSLGDQLAFDDMSFRVTTARPGKADQTEVATSQNLSIESVADINRISADKLKPAPETPEEQRRELIKPTVAPSDDRPNTHDSGPFDTPKTPNVHDISDIEEFLRFAGSGLTPQEPLSSRAANPFGLNGKKVDMSAGSDKQKSTGDNRAAPSDQIPDNLPLEPSKPHREKPSPTPRSLPRVNPAELDDDQTRYVSLNTMDRYVSTNERYNSELNVGNGPRLIVMTAPIRGKVYLLDCDDDVKCWSIGRDDSADICLRDKAVSREHAWITKLDALYQLRVNESASDILVNGETVTEIDLKHGDRLQFGTMEIVFRLDSVGKNMLASQGLSKSWFARIVQSFLGRQG